MTQSTEIHMLPSGASSNTVDIAHMTNMVNRVYAATEESIWRPGAVRTTVADMADLTNRGEIAVAQSMGQIVGCVRVRQIDEETGGLGMLAVDDACQGTGTGRALIRFAEQKCQKEQFRKMQLELLVPQEGSHPTKVNLENWYVRIGYEPVYTEIIDASFPELMQMLAVPCQFVVFQKAFKSA